MRAKRRWYDMLETTLQNRRLGYLANQYPKASHSFIRREIRALESLGWDVERFALRIPIEEIVDPEDLIEAKNTRSIVDAGPRALGGALLRSLCRNPIAVLAGLRCALRLARRSDVGVLRHFVYLAEGALLVEWSAQADVSHIHTHFGTNSAEVALLCYRLGGPTYSITIHGPEEFDRAPLLGIAEKITNARFVATVSSFGRSQACRLVPTQYWDQIHVIHCGLSDEWFDGETAPITDTTKLVSVARLSEQKGQGVLIAALAEVAAMGRDFEMTLVGDGELRDQVQEQINELGISDRVTITGWAAEDAVKAAINDAAGFVLPSFAEGLPVVIMEALAAGRPVISTYVAGIPELVRPGVSGWLVPAGSVDDLVLAICELLESSLDELETLGNNGREAVAERHRARTEAAKLDRLFRSVNGTSVGQESDAPDDDSQAFKTSRTQTPRANN